MLPNLLILGFAALYLAFTVSKTKLFAPIRERLPLGGLTTCFYCCAFWTALGFWVLWRIGFQDVVTVFAVAGLAITVANYVGLAQQ